MADVIRTLGPAGGSPDYTSMVTWEASEQVDLVAAGDTHTLLVRTMTLQEQVNIDWPDGNDTYHITIEPDDGHHHGGVDGAGFIWSLDAPWERGIFSSAYTVVRGISATGDNQNVFITSANNVTYDGILLYWGADNYNAAGAINFGSAQNTKVQNCVFRNTRTIGNAYILHLGSAHPSTEITNCTFRLEGNADAAFMVDSASSSVDVLIRNNVYINSGFGAYVARWWNGGAVASTVLTNAANTNNRSFTGLDTHGLNSADDVDLVDFEDASALDFTPITAGDVYQSGADLSAEFTLDVTGSTRSAWSAGAYDGEPVAGSETVIPDDIGQAQTLGAVTLTQAYTISVDSVTQAQGIDSPDIAQANTLAVDDIGQAQEIGGVTLTLPGAPGAIEFKDSAQLSDTVAVASITMPVAAPVVAGDMILLIEAPHRADRGVVTVESQNGRSFTLQDESPATTGVAGGSIWTLICDGTETDINLTYSGNARHSVSQSVFGGNPVVVGKAANHAEVANVVDSINTDFVDTTGAVTAVYFFNAGNGGSWNNGFNVSDGTLREIPDSGNTFVSTSIADADHESNGPKSATFSAPGDVGSAAYAGVIILQGSSSTSAPTVTLDPLDTVALDGETVTFTSAASGAPDPSPQWEINTGGGWSDIVSATNASYTTPTLSLADTGNLYRCRWENSEGTATSAQAALTVTTGVRGLSIIGATQPLGVTEDHTAHWATAPFAILEQDQSSSRLGWSAPYQGVAKYLTVNMSNDTDSDIVLHLYDSIVGMTSLSVTIPAGQSGYFQSDPADSYIILQDDMVWFEESTRSSTSGTYTYYSQYFLFTPDDAVALTLLGSNNPGSSNFNDDDVLSYGVSFGLREQCTQEEGARLLPLGGSLHNFAASTGTVARTSDTVIGTEIAGVTGDASLLFEAGSSTNIMVVDYLSEQNVTSWQDYGVYILNGPGAGEAFNTEKWHSTLVNLLGETALVAASNKGGSTLLDGLTTYLPPLGAITASALPETESQAQLLIPPEYGFQPSILYFEFGEALQTTPTTFTVRVNGASTAVQVIVSAGADRLVTVDASSLTFTPGDLVCIQVTSASGSGALKLRQSGFVGTTFTPVSSETITPDSLSQSQTLASVVLTQASTMAVDEITQTQNIDNLTLSEAQLLSADNLTQAQYLDNVTLTQAYIIVINDLAQGQTLDAVTLSEDSVLSVAGLNQEQIIGQVALTEAGTVAIESMAQGQEIEQVILTQDNIVDPDGVTQSQLLDTVELTQGFNVSIAEILQSQRISTVSLAVAGSIAVDRIRQPQQIDLTNLTQANILNIDDLAQAQQIDVADLVRHYAVEIDGLIQAQEISAVTLTLGGALVNPDAITQRQAIGEPLLTEHAILSVNDLSQSQIIDIVRLGGVIVGELDGTLVIYSALDGAVVAKTSMLGDIITH